MKTSYTTSRICMITDAVLAIVVTMLALKLTTFLAPKIAGWKNIIHFWEEVYFHISNFLISYVIIGWFWYLHHLLFMHVKSVNAAVLFLNMFHLLLLCCIPFALEILSNNPHNMVAEVFFWTLYILIIVVFTCIIYLIDRTLIEEKEFALKESMRFIKNDTAILSLAGALALGLSYVYPGYSLFFWAALPLIFKIVGVRLFNIRT